MFMKHNTTDYRMALHIAQGALDLAQSLLQHSAHHTTILDAYSDVRYALEQPISGLSAQNWGKTLLDEFAMAALSGVIQSRTLAHPGKTYPGGTLDAKIAFSIAEHCMAESEQRQSTTTATQQEPQWQPISTCPRIVGQLVLVKRDCGEGSLASCSIAFAIDFPIEKKDEWHAADSSETLEDKGYRVTHWMPLPSLD
jgi:hypothetical protein